MAIVYAIEKTASTKNSWKRPINIFFFEIPICKRIRGVMRRPTEIKIHSKMIWIRSTWHFCSVLNVNKIAQFQVLPFVAFARQSTKCDSILLDSVKPNEDVDLVSLLSTLYICLKLSEKGCKIQSIYCLHLFKLYLLSQKSTLNHFLVYSSHSCNRHIEK